MPPREPPIIPPQDQGGTVTLPPRGGDPHTPPPDAGGGGGDIVPSGTQASRNTNQEARTRTLSFGGVGQCIPVSWGRVEVGGDIVFARTVGNLCYIVAIIGRGPINSMSSIRVGGKSMADLGLVQNLSYNFYLGTPDQVVDPIIASVEPGWEFAMPGLAYVTYKLTLSNSNAGNVDPKEIKVIVDGMLVRDYAQDPTLVTRYYTENPVWIMADFMTSRRYGLGERDENLDWAGSWSTAAAICDVVVEPDVDAPTTAPSITLIGGGYLGLTNHGLYSWQTSFLNALGKESLPGPASDVAVPGIDHAWASISDIEIGGVDVVERRLYRTKADGLTPRQLDQRLVNNTATGIVDSMTDSQLGAYVNDLTTALQFRLGLTLNQPSTAAQFIESTRGQFQAYMSFNNGKYQIFIDTDNGIDDILFDENNISGWPTIESVGLEQIPTRVTVGYTKQQDQFKQDTAKEEDPNISTPLTEAERVEIREAKYSYYGIPSYDQAFRIAHWLLKRGQLDKKVSWRTNQVGTRPIPGTVVRVRFAALKLWDQADDTLGQAVVVTQCAPAQDTLGWQLSGEFYDPSIYDTTYRNPFDPPGGPGDPPDPPPPPPPPGSDIAMRAQFWMDQNYQPGLGG